MKKAYYLFFTTLLAVLLISPGAFAQQTAETDGEKTVRIKIITKDGDVIVKKKRINSGNLPDDFEEFEDLKSEDIANIEVEVIDSRSCDKAKLKCEEKDKFFFFKGAGYHSDYNFVEEEDMQAFQEEIRRNRRNFKFGENPKPLVGIYPDGSYEGRGVKIDETISGKGAAAAGLMAGDVILKIGEKDIDRVDDIGSAIKANQPGDKVMVTFERNGTTLTKGVVLSEGRSRFRQHRYNYNRYERQPIERDPCKVFIGVYTKNNRDDNGGVRVTKIIENTAAADMDLQQDDIIIEIDKVEVNSQPDLVIERDQNEPGDYFKLTIIRDGKRKTVRGQFKECEKETPAIEEIPEINTPGNGSLQLNRFEAYPNPTLGEVTIEFTAEPVPTTVRITDVTGKVVYEESLQNFDGVYKKEIKLRRAAPGNISLSVIQNNQAISKKLLLLNRA